MNSELFFGVSGVVLLVWGSIVAIWNHWAARFMKRVQGIYGKRAANMVTPGYVRFLGISLAAGGSAFVLLTLLGAFPDHT
jgi:hypothetical protein